MMPVGPPMTKPRKDRSATTLKAPRATQPEAPSFPVKKLTASDKTRPINRHTKPGPTAAASDSLLLGARISRRAADRLRSGHLWVYASDIEAIQTHENDPPALMPVADSR